VPPQSASPQFDESPFPVEGDNSRVAGVSSQKFSNPSYQTGGQHGYNSPGGMMGGPVAPVAPSTGNGTPDWFSQSGLAQAVTSAALSAAISNNGDPSRMIGGLAANVEKSSQTWFQSQMANFKEYFNVTHAYVRWKLLYVLLPFLPNSYSLVSRTVSREVPHQADDDEGGKTSRDGGGMGLRLMPGRRPDLYIPLMGYITFILAYGFSKGTSFHPDDLYNIASLAGVLGILEVLAIKGAAYIFSIPTLSFIDVVAICGYKFINLCVSAIGLILLGPAASRTIWLFLWVWASAMAGLTVQKGLMAAISYNSSVSQYMGTGSANMERLLSLVAGAGQIFWCWILMPALTVVDPAPVTGRRVYPGSNADNIRYVESTGGG